MKFEEEKISIIIPVYNVEKYLRKCVQSILNQTYSNLEILLIDDGSTDESGRICEELNKNDSRIKVLHKKNGGVSSARNLGIKRATGKYLIFIDSDDYLEKNMIEVLYNNLRNNNVDISICEYYMDYGNSEIEKRHDNAEEFILNKEDFYKYILDNKYFGGYLYNKLIKRELIYNEKSIILFDENIHICEDLLYMCQIAQNMDKAYYTTTPYYYYVQRKDGTIRKIYSEKQLSNFYAYKKIIEIYNANSMPIDIKFQVKFLKFCIDSLFLIKLLKNKDKNFKKQILQAKKKYYKIIKESRDVKLKEKLKIMLSYYFPYVIGRIKYIKRKMRREC